MIDQTTGAPAVTSVARTIIEALEMSLNQRFSTTPCSFASRSLVIGSPPPRLDRTSLAAIFGDEHLARRARPAGGRGGAGIGRGSGAAAAEETAGGGYACGG